MSAEDVLPQQPPKGKGKGKGKQKGGNSYKYDQVASQRGYLQDRARELLLSKGNEGICGGHLTQLLMEAEEATVTAAFASKQEGGPKLQRGWLQTLMQHLPDVESEKAGGGRDFMYKIKEGAVISRASTYADHNNGTSVEVPQLFASAALSQKLAAGKPAASMEPRDYLGSWMDSLGNSVQVIQNAHDTGFTAVLSKQGRQDIVLPMFPMPIGGGWMTWQCGNSMLNLGQSTSAQLIWATTNARVSVWMRAPQQTKPKEKKERKERKPRADQKEKASEKPATTDAAATNTTEKVETSTADKVDAPAGDAAEK